MITEASVYAAFSALVVLYAGQFSPAVPVYFDGTSMDPPDSGYWFEVRMFPGEGANYGLADTGPTVHRGFLQVTVNYRSNVGMVLPLQVAAGLIAEISKGTAIGGAKIYRKPYISSSFMDDDRIVIPVTFPYVADSDNEVVPALFLDGGAPDSDYTNALTLVGS